MNDNIIDGPWNTVTGKIERLWRDCLNKLNERQLENIEHIREEMALVELIIELNNDEGIDHTVWDHLTDKLVEFAKNKKMNFEFLFGMTTFKLLTVGKQVVRGER